MPQSRDGVLGNPAGAITAAREPDRIDRRIVGAFEQGGEAQRVRAGEVSVGLKALRVKMEGEVGEFLLGTAHPAEMFQERPA